MRYPVSFYVGLLLSCVGLLCLTISYTRFCVARDRRQRRPVRLRHEAMIRARLAAPTGGDFVPLRDETPPPPPPPEPATPTTTQAVLVREVQR